MKVLLLIASLCLILSSVTAYHKFAEPQFRSSEGVFEYVMNGNHQIYILFIYNGNWAPNDMHNPMRSKYDLERRDLLKVIERYGRDVHFSEIDVSSGDFTSLLQEAGISSADLDSNPITLVIDDGHGFWVQGPREYSKVAKIINEFVEDPDTHRY